jgi:hypothetical protein
VQAEVEVRGQASQVELEQAAVFLSFMKDQQLHNQQLVRLLQ